MQPAIEVRVAQGNKCPRCWHYHELRDTPDNLCDRCMLVLQNTDSELVETINEYYVEERKKYCTLHDNTQCNKMKCCMGGRGSNYKPH